ncbi:hypothetical protein HMPREF9151_01326 [Hoylesella saccharolytica F0055]|uniref:Uncharacterized protein n=1 Tax=Hoylesella saccharolytica F0055 TaxID=1127699 RepID=L1NAW2_9BACT|nr:hypothetical protein HMPREF9151_01326 [Hoylesella saccharolytica F0055]
MPIYLPTKTNTATIEDMSNNRLVPVGLYPFCGDVYWCPSIQLNDCICFRTFPRSNERIKDMSFDIHPRSYRSSKRDVIEDTYPHRHIRQCKNMAR